MECFLVILLISVAQAAYTEKDGEYFMKNISNKSQQLGSLKAYAEWNYGLTLTDEAKNASVTANDNYDNYQIEVYPEVVKFQWKTFKDEYLKRQFYFESFLDEAALSTEKRSEYRNITNEMLDIYSTAKVKEYQSNSSNATLFVDDLAGKFSADFLNADEMTYYWKEWHDTVGRAEKSRFQRWIALENETAILNNYTNNAERWKAKFETKDFEKVIKQLYNNIKPLFKELHAYLRYKLWIAHGKNSSIIDLKGPIPASLLGNLWGLDAIGLNNFTQPYPNKTSLDISSELQAQNYTGLKMAQTSEQFYRSLNMSEMTAAFWNNSVFQRNSDTMDCSPVAYNFYNGYDYRIKFCTSPTMDDFGRMHHEMGHIENYMAWKDLPWLYEDAPNPGFNEALGDLLYLYATSPKHLMDLGLLNSTTKLDKEQEINAQFSQALAVVFFLPYAYSLDLWRWRVMQGKITPDNYNCEYWKIRIALQGVEPPVARNESDFDPGAKYHVISGDQYISYFVSGILQYQFLRSLCITSGYYNPNNSTGNPLVFCDIYNSTAAGNNLKKMMALGKSRPWPDALEIITGQRAMDTSPLLEFYQPLYQWLKQENKKNKVKTGWNCGHQRCKS